jgi:Fe-Mn family superoxide dismutase
MVGFMPPGEFRSAQAAFRHQSATNESSQSKRSKIMAFELPPLPFDKSALEPHMSAKTLEFHHGKHHRAYVDTLNKLIEGTGLEKESLENIIMATAGDDRTTQKKTFNNAGQVWNHTFFWNCLTPGGGAPKGDLKKRMDAAFGDFDKFKETFKKAGVDQFGSGWAWLVVEDGTLKVRSTPNAVPPMVEGQTALLTCDVWEHAYYLDYQNRRPDFVQAFLDKLVNWEFVAECLANAEAESRPARKKRTA